MPDETPVTPAPSDDRLDRYLDGLMPEPEAKAFERDLAADPRLEEAAALQRAIDSAVLGQVPDDAGRADRLLAALPAADAPTLVAGRAGRPVWLKAAAVVVLLVLGAAAAYMQLRPTPGLNRSTYQEVVVEVGPAYTAMVEAGFEPEWVCDRALFRSSCEQWVGRPLELAALPADRSMLGMSYVDRGLGRTVAMLGRVDGEPVVVIIDKPGERRHYRLDPPAGLHVHEVVADGLRLIEVSPRDTPVFLEYLAVPADDPSASD